MLAFAWDANQRLIASRRQSAGEVAVTTYGYDPLGRRVFKETAGRRVRYGWDGDAITCDACAADGRAREFVNWPGGFRPMVLLTVSEVYAYTNDVNGAPMRLTDRGGRGAGPRPAAPGGGGQGRRPSRSTSRSACRGQYRGRRRGSTTTGTATSTLRSRPTCRPIRSGWPPARTCTLTGRNVFSWIDPHGLSQTYWLEKSLEAAGRPLAPGQTAHHIVQQNNPSRYADLSRQLLDRHGLSPEIAENGARLWGTAGSQVATSAHPGRVNARGVGNYHAGPHIHGPANDKLIFRILRRAEERGGAQGVRVALADIGRRMEHGSWLRAFRGCGG